MGKHELRCFECKPYTITLESGKKIKITTECYAGVVRKDGSFLGAVFDNGNYEGEVDYSPEEARERLGRELFLTEAEE